MQIDSKNTKKNMKKNILFIHHNAATYGGGEQSLFLLLSKLNRRQFTPFLVCTSKNLLFEKVKELGIEAKVIEDKYLKKIGRIRLLYLLFQMAVYMKKKKMSLIHVNSLGRLHYIILFCKLLGIRTVYHLRSLLLIKGASRQTRFVINLSDRVIAHSEYMKEVAIKCGIKKEKINIINNGVDIEEFNPEISGDGFKEKLGIGKDTHLVGMIGRIVPWKGCDDFVRAARKVIESSPDTKFVIVGEAPDKQYLERLITLSEELGIKDKIIFIGLHSNMPHVYAALDILTLPSWEEPFSRVVLEAMAMRKPVIATNTGGTPEQIQHEVNGLLIPARNPHALAQAIITVIQDKTKAREMGFAGRKMIEEYFGIKEHIQKIETLYRSLLKNERILIYTHEFPPIAGGAATYSYEIARELNKLGQKVIILTVQSENARLFDRELSFQIVRMPLINGRNKQRIMGLCGLIYSLLRYRPQKILITDKWAQEVCSFACLLLPFKYFLTVHGSEVLLNTDLKKGRWRLRKCFFLRLCNNAQKIFAVSEYTKELLIKAGISSDNIIVLPNGIDIRRFSRNTDGRKLKEKLGIKDESIILTLARLHPRKGQDIVIKALPYVLRRVPNTKYVIAGAGEDYERLVMLVKEYNLNGNVIFSGYIPDDQIIKFYDICDVFVMPSRQEGPWVEGFGISFLEASARGKPVIGGDHGGVREVIIDGQTGIVVNPYNPEEIAEAIINILTDKEYAVSLGERGRQRCFTYFNWERIAQRTLEVINANNF
jgi:phosphatidylinositol alpha-1,6-mannosyltransferase